MQIRINKYLSLCGVGPRRLIEDLLKRGEFEVNKKTAEPGMMIDDEKDLVVWKGMVLTPHKNFVYYALNKPAGYVSTVSDEEGRQTVMDLVPSAERLYPVGRLDKDSTGLILLTNDGDFALKITHPRYHLPKTYQVTTWAPISDTQLKMFADGIELQDGSVTLPAKVTRTGDKSFEIILHQGLKRQIREMCRAVDLNVNTLHRVSIGPVKIGNLKSGLYRELTDYEKRALQISS